MFVFFDYTCTDSDCPSKGIIEELFIDAKEVDVQTCPECGTYLQRQPAAPKGYVQGTRTPCRQ